MNLLHYQQYDYTMSDNIIIDPVLFNRENNLPQIEQPLTGPFWVSVNRQPTIEQLTIEQPLTNRFWVSDNRQAIMKK